MKDRCAFFDGLAQTAQNYIPFKGPTKQPMMISQQPNLVDIRHRSRSFDEFVLMFEGRLCNRVAHQCAKLVSGSSLVEEWPCPPPEIHDLLAADCNNSVIQ